MPDKPSDLVMHRMAKDVEADVREATERMKSMTWRDWPNEALVSTV